jgi:crooked neck
MTAAKKILGTAIGMCPKEKLFKAYIELRTKVRDPRPVAASPFTHGC